MHDDARRRSPPDRDGPVLDCPPVDPLLAGTGASVADAMIRIPKVCDSATTVADARDELLDDHVHALLVVDDGMLLAVVERPDVAVAPPDIPAMQTGRLHGRVVPPDADLLLTWRRMQSRGRRRLAVVNDDGVLLGLLCLKGSERGFCSDAGVRARAEEGARGG